MSAVMTTGRVKCGNRKAHGYDSVVYHSSAKAVQACYAGNTVDPAPCCDGTGWTGDPKAPCAEHYQPQSVAFEAPAPAPAPVKRVSIEEIQSWSKIPVGRGDKAFYALETLDGHVDFFRVRRPSEGKYRGKTFVDQQAGDTFDRLPFLTAAKVLSKVAANPLAAAALYGQKIEKCGMCHRTLTDDTNRGPDGLTSLERGIGPDCAKKLGMV